MATFVPEQDYKKAQAGEWLAPPPAPQSAEGVIKMRGLPFTATKQDIVLFFTGFGLEVRPRVNKCVNNCVNKCVNKCVNNCSGVLSAPLPLLAQEVP
eukprot:4329595-Pyramimonas_sp.AAC.1